MSNLEIQQSFREVAPYLLDLDTQMGLVSSLACTGHLRLLTEDFFRFTEYVKKLRTCVAKQDLIFSEKEKENKLTNLQRAEAFIFRKPLKTNRLPRSFMSEIAHHLYEERYIEKPEMNGNGNGNYVVQKGLQITGEKYIDETICNLFPEQQILFEPIAKDNPLEEPKLHVLERIKQSIELLDEMNTVECRKNFSSDSSASYEYKNLFNLPLVSVDRESDNDNVIYMLSCFKSKEKDLERIHVHYEQLIMKLLEDKKILSLFRNIVEKFKQKKYMFGNRMILKKKDTDTFFVLNYITFNKAALKSSNNTYHRMKKIYVGVHNKGYNAFFKSKDYFAVSVAGARNVQ